AVAEGVFAGRAAAAVEGAGQGQALGAVAADVADGHAVADAGQALDGAALADAAEAAGGGQVGRGGVLVAVPDADRLVRVDRTGDADLGLAVHHVVDVGVELLGGRVDVGRDERVLALLLRLLGLDNVVVLLGRHR